MPERRFTLTRGGYRFVFNYDDVDPSLLHIYARHLKTPDDAIFVFFHGVDTFNADRNRFETSTDTVTLYWFWIVVDEVVMVVSCFDKE